MCRAFGAGLRWVGGVVVSGGVRSGTPIRQRRANGWASGKCSCKLFFMSNPLLWLEALAGLKALYDLAEGAPDYVANLRRHMEESATINEARRVAETFSTYSDDEIRAILKRIEGCRARFIAQGGGEDRTSCLCSIFKEIKDGNGGFLPLIDDWARMYKRLNCQKASE